MILERRSIPNLSQSALENICGRSEGNKKICGGEECDGIIQEILVSHFILLLLRPEKYKLSFVLTSPPTPFPFPVKLIRIPTTSSSLHYIPYNFRQQKLILSFFRIQSSPCLRTLYWRSSPLSTLTSLKFSLASLSPLLSLLSSDDTLVKSHSLK